MLVFRAALDIEGALAEAQLVQLRQLLLPHCHVLEFAAVRQHSKKLQYTLCYKQQQQWAVLGK